MTDEEILASFKLPIWAINGQNYGWNDDERKQGWQTIGDSKPTRAQFNALQQLLDYQVRYLFNQITPAGIIVPFGGSAAPSGFLACDGSLVSRTDYANLYAAIGTTWGMGDGSTTFAVPDLRGVFLRGVDGGRGLDTGRTLGSTQQSQNLAHTHTATADNDAHEHSGKTSQVTHSHTMSGYTASAGEHAHNYSAALQVTDHDRGTKSSSYSLDDMRHVRFPMSAQETRITAKDGNHSHYFSGTTSNDIHGHTITTNKYVHTHAISIAQNGGRESRPINAAILYIIKA